MIDRLMVLLEAYPALKIVFIVAVVAVILSILGKLFRLALAILLVSALITIFSSVILGDGTEYVSKAAQFLPEEYQNKVEDTYQDFRLREAEDPVLDYEKLRNGVQNRVEEAKDAVSDAIGKTS